MLITNRHIASRPIRDIVEAAIKGGVDAVQIREKDLDRDDLRLVAQTILDAVPDGFPVIMNGNIDLATTLSLGLHLPEKQTIPDPGAFPLLGRSVHAPESASAEPITDYLIAGTIFPTSSKPGAPGIGLHGLKAIVGATNQPVLAIGGIEPHHVASVLAVGAHGIGVMSGILTADDPEAAARAFSQAFQGEHPMLKPEPPTGIEVTVNGKPLVLEKSMTIQEFLEMKGLHENMVVVEHNGVILKKVGFQDAHLGHGDIVEVVHFVGGGHS